MAQLAHDQHGVVSLAQLVALGFSARTIQRLARRGLLHRRYPGVYAVGHTRLTVEGRWLAATLACGPGATLSHGEAAGDLRRVGAGAIHGTAEMFHRLPGIRVHLDALPDAHRRRVDAIPMTTVERTIADCAASEPLQRVRTLAENAMRREIVDFAILRAIAADRFGRPGAPALRRLIAELDDVAPRTHAGLEQRFLELIRTAGLPAPAVNTIVEGFEVDFCWSPQRLIVETDGWAFHRGRRSFEADRRKDAVLIAAGWTVLRITDERLTTNPAGVLAQLHTLLAA